MLFAVMLHVLVPQPMTLHMLGNAVRPIESAYAWYVRMYGGCE
jgi:hypothetical protein